MRSGSKKKGNLAGGYGTCSTSQRIVGARPDRGFIVILVVVALAGLGGCIGIGFLRIPLATWPPFP